MGGTIKASPGSSSPVRLLLAGVDGLGEGLERRQRYPVPWHGLA